MDILRIDPQLITHKSKVDLERKFRKQKKRNFTPKKKDLLTRSLKAHGSWI